MPRNIRLFALLVGIPMIPLGLSILRKDLHARGVQHAFVSQETIDALFPHTTNPNAPAMTALIYVTAPQRIRVGEAAPVSIEELSPEGRRHSFRLSASGLDVEPNDWIPPHAVSEDFRLVALWSIRATSPGSYSLVFNAKIDQQSNKLETLAVHFFPSDSLTISVVRGWIDYFKMVSGPLLVFMGSLASLPGIISFLKNRKREREEQRRSIQAFE
jgi:hypothetical protein